ncbi:FIVAR domain-containing protein [Mycoplasmoides gallisepticum]|uniref:Variably expressed lipoprotein and hemagglutinin (VlhA) family protein n=1 Tax=Mycoplasmoides gallisepticum WI01_2001.043-13-2P TaxID=1159201 RepID=J3TRR0_MYCGL|nr:FIVAR domain-containing protein [Mycoplasmoides gallisepticum]AFP76355.1 variably expressed lipoprotein and hemagglutinin (VlhA) family protein [Mycoplasmoides gallisepticum VA94_7994-1-7P]AFP77123.1 variably expressed lipoprotein and hemagglutinin (VlhA) family protein [Mycoplasmoides gallisepticum NC95_13295-2-2P]AFP79407.1 variably expressed lipoprotein and hemagglutinin (VlhA) family protein [Mycoplasmoides gallisepticum WI01_2001.043-13-2P]AFP81653.1 variably expressed lipoprotein and h
MKRKNILKFVSLLGIGSFVMLAAASCTTATTPTPNPEPKPTPNPEPKPDPMPNPPSGGMNGGNTNPGGGQGMMDSVAQELTDAKKVLSDLIGEESKTVELYADYAKIKADLTSAYTVAKTTSDSSTSTLDQVKTATSKLQTAIDKAVSDKRAFDSANQPLVTAYNNLKTTLQSKTNSLEGLSENKYSSIKNHLSELFDAGSAITARTLDPTMGTVPEVLSVTKANEDITTAVSKLREWKTNADKFNNFEKKSLLRANFFSENSQTQPGNWSFVGYSNNLNTGSSNQTNLSNWNFAKRQVWLARADGSTDLVQNPTESTDVAWIYNLAGEGAKYTLHFTYYGPSTANLYFPYKLVNENDNVGLQYILNENSPKEINFRPTTRATENVSSNDAQTESVGNAGNTASSEILVADEVPSANNEMNTTPTVSDINVAKITLSNLKFGENTIEFSVPTIAGEQSPKVAPMIGNMYLTSNLSSKENIYDDIFGNIKTVNQTSSSVTVNLLKGYSLASSFAVYVGQFTSLTNAGAQATDSQVNTPNYLIGFIGGSGRRIVNNVRSETRSPLTTGSNRTLTIYVNAPQSGEYNISGSYISGATQPRGLKFSTGDMAENVVTVTNLKQNNWTTLGFFDTSKTTTQVGGADNMMKKTLTLNKGLNKIIVASGTTNNGDAPFVGNLTFTLNNVQTTSNTSESNDNTASAA